MFLIIHKHPVSYRKFIKLLNNINAKIIVNLKQISYFRTQLYKL